MRSRIRSLSLLCSTLLCAALQAQQPAPATKRIRIAEDIAPDTIAPGRGDTTLLASKEKTAPFEIKDGDRVLLLGDALLERENTYGNLETRMHEQFPDRTFTVRNLSWSGDTPAGWSRASFDPPEKGMERLKEQIAMVKPTVVFLGYGMAASLQELTDRSRDWTLNPDPARYGREPMTAARFKKELGELMDAIDPTSATSTGRRPAVRFSDPNLSPERSTGIVRFVLLSPIQHADVRPTKPGSPDPAEHNKLLEEYSKAIAEVGEQRGVRVIQPFTATSSLTDDLRKNPVSSERIREEAQSLMPDGIHLSEYGHRVLSRRIAEQLNWPDLPEGAGMDPEKRRLVLKQAVLRKADLFFHRFRPANSTYLFGFRKHEQGQNAKEMEAFESHLQQAEAEIDRLKRVFAKATRERAAVPDDAAFLQLAKPQPAPTAPAKDFTKAEALPLPSFDVQEGLEVTLWAGTPLLGKPTEINWDADGRLWVACTPIYPQIEPGAHPDDKVVVLEDTDRDGKADKSTTFADDLLIPTGVLPDISTAKGPASYVAASTEILRLVDTDGDGRADRRDVVLSGFGTEDTHHNVHTLRWGPDGRLYFNQSVYPHTHLETPWGMVRLNAGGVFAYDPRTERVEVFSKGLWNPWGHAWDRWGQSFLTDGAGFAGLAWAFPGAVFNPSEGARKIMPTISPGNYPKFAGLEIVHSPLFPDDWQGTAVTCDFRAHRVVRFAIDDLSEEKTAKTPRTQREEKDTAKQPVAPVASSQFTPKSGYITRELPDLLRTADLAFRPIDVKLGPDGALYIADWTNPVINHGEVDFRDPRRDHVHGRIWRVAPKGKKTIAWKPIQSRTKTSELLANLVSRDQWSKEQSRRELIGRSLRELSTPATATSKASSDLRAIIGWEAENQSEGDDLARLVAVRLHQAIGDSEALTNIELTGMKNSGGRSGLARVVGSGAGPLSGDAEQYLKAAAKSDQSRVRIEAIRAASRFPTPFSIEAVLTAALNAPKDDPYYEFAAWRSINDLADVWVEAVLKGDWKPEGKEKQLEYALGAIEPDLGSKVLTHLVNAGKVPFDGSGPWIELLGRAGDAAALQRLWDPLLVAYAGDCCETDETRALSEKVQHFPNEAVAKRALAALLDAARTRSIRPAERSHLATVLFHAKEPLRSNAVELAGLWKAPQTIEKVGELLADREASPELRRTIAGALRALNSPEALSFLEVLTRQDQPIDLRTAALVAIAQVKLDAGIIKAAEVFPDLTDEALALKTWQQLLQIKGAPEALTAKLVRSDAAKNFPPAMLKAALKASQQQGKKTEALTAALTSLTGAAAKPGQADAGAIAAMLTGIQQGGDPAEGERIYHRAALACTTCHSIGGAGGKLGPDLTSMGASAPADYIVESVLAPAAKVKEGYHAFSFTMKDGTVMSGIPARETDKELFIRPGPGPEVPLVKANITKRDPVESLMPAGLIDALSYTEKRALFAFLTQLGKAGPFDASKGNVARVWWLHGTTESSKVLAGTAEGGLPVYTHVDGKLERDKLTETAKLVSDGPVLASTKLQVGTPGKVKLDLLGIREAWLDGQALPVASEPSPTLDLTAGPHTLVVKVDSKQLPDAIRAGTSEGRFLTE